MRNCVLIQTCWFITLTALAPARIAAAPRSAEVPAKTYTLPAFSLSRFGSPAFTGAELAQAQRNGLKFIDRPSIGSGLARAGEREFWGITDRGPNGIPGAYPDAGR